ncbi:MAG: sseB [Alphaproteobacteria bacterium]|nr:sseB [Alphaproteobacteria bacterium]
MPFQPENDIEVALLQAAQNPDAATALHRLMLNGDLLVLGTVAGQEDATQKVNLEPGGKLQLVVGDRNGEKFLPVFTSMTRMQAYLKEPGKFLAANGRALLDLTRGAPVTLNPGSDHAMDFSPEMVARILDSQILQGRPKVNLGLEVFPTGMVEVLTAIFAKDSAVLAAWMIGVEFADRAGQRHPLVGIETGGDMAALLSDIERAAQVSLPGLVFDVQRVDRKRPAGMADAMLQLEPFYERGQPAPKLN